MAMGSNHDQLMSDINVTPFVDVMLVLLIIFMVTAPMMIQGVNIALPQTTSKPLVSEQEPLVINIDNKGKIFIIDTEVNFDRLQPQLSGMLNAREDRTVYLRADKQLTYGIVVQVMAEIKRAGVEKLGMVTEPASENKKKRKAEKGSQ